MTAGAKRIALIAGVVVILAVAVVGAISSNAPTPTIAPLDPGTGTPQPTGGDASDGNSLIDDRCTVCHSRTRIDEAGYDRTGWQGLVERMVRYGAKLSEEEQATLIEYLSTR